MNQVNDIFSHQNRITLLINDVTLFGQNIIVILEVFTDIEVLAFDLFLSVGNGVGKHPVLVRIVLEIVREHLSDVIRSKPPHKFIVERDEETGIAWIALTARTSAQLVIDTAGFMTFRAEDTKSA